MADDQQIHHHSGAEVEGEGEVKDRGLFDFMGKKKKEDGQGEKEGQEEAMMTEFDKVKLEDTDECKKVEMEEKKEEKHSIFEKLHRSGSSSSSSSSDEEGEGKGEKKEKKKKKKGLKEKLTGEKKEEDTTVTVEKVECTGDHPDQAPQVVMATEEKKGFMDKIKKKLPGHHKKAGEEESPVPVPVPPPPPPSATPAESGEHVKEHEGEGAKEKKGFLEKIMDKIPGYHKNEGGEHGGAPASH